MTYKGLLLLILGLLLLSCGLINKDRVAAMAAPPAKQEALTVRPDTNEEQPGYEVPEPTIRFVGMVRKFESTTIRSQEETNKEYGYAFDRGTAARIESGEVRPRTARPGKDVQLVLTYVILTHSRTAVDVREIREIWFKDALWERLEVETEKTGGTYRSVVPLRLPENSEKGTYKVVYIIQTAHSRDLREATFSVGAPPKTAHEG